MATNDSDQYAAMVAGVEEVVTTVARYQHVEEIYRHRGATRLKAEFEQQLVSLYGHIIRYQIAASSYYRRSTLGESSPPRSSGSIFVTLNPIVRTIRTSHAEAR